MTLLRPPVRTHESLHGAGDRTVRRSWIVVPASPHSDEPELAGLLGARWTQRRVEARCLAYGDEGALHPTVPDPACTCGLYGTSGVDDPTAGLMPHGVPLAFGFVRLSGRVIDRGDVARAQRAEILGPVALSLGLARLPTRAVIAAGAHRRPSRVRRDVEAFHVGWGSCDRGAEVWMNRAARRLEIRYGVPFLPGPSPAGRCLEPI